jgi:hypothetical protein
MGCPLSYSPVGDRTVEDHSSYFPTNKERLVKNILHIEKDKLVKEVFCS